jgi:hypothetical protein
MKFKCVCMGGDECEAVAGVEHHTVHLHHVCVCMSVWEGVSVRRSWGLSTAQYTYIMICKLVCVCMCVCVCVCVCHLKVGWRSRERLNVHSPLGRVQSEGLEGSTLHTHTHTRIAQSVHATSKPTNTQFSSPHKRACSMHTLANMHTHQNVPHTCARTHTHTFTHIFGVSAKHFPIHMHPQPHRAKRPHAHAHAHTPGTTF